MNLFKKGGKNKEVAVKQAGVDKHLKDFIVGEFITLAQRRAMTKPQRLEVRGVVREQRREQRKLNVLKQLEKDEQHRANADKGKSSEDSQVEG